MEKETRKRWKLLKIWIIKFFIVLLKNASMMNAAKNVLMKASAMKRESNVVEMSDDVEEVNANRVFLAIFAI